VGQGLAVHARRCHPAAERLTVSAPAFRQGQPAWV